MKTLTYPVRDLPAAVAFYRTVLGVEPSIDQTYYAAFSVDGVDLGLDPNGHAKGFTGPVSFWNSADVRKDLARWLEAGAVTVQEPTEVGGGTLIATVRDADGNLVGLVGTA